MNAKTVLAICSFFLMSAFISAKKVAALPELMRPNIVLVHNGRLYVADGAQIYIYSLNPFKIIKKFGKKGEGPQEFLVYTAIGGLSIFPNKDKILVSSIGKLSFFTLDGDFIKEIKHGVLFGAAQFYPFGDKFVSKGFRQEKNDIAYTVDIFDSNLKKEKEIVMYLLSGSGTSFGSAFAIQCSNNKVFLAVSKDFVIDVFDGEGKKLYSIKQKYNNLKFTNRDEETVLDWYKHNPATRDFFEMIKKTMKFPSTFPAIRDFTVDDGKIYVQTYLLDSNNIEFFVFEIKGKLLKKVWLPVIRNNPIEPSQLFTIKKGKIYQLVENEEGDVWELDIAEIGLSK